ncbi:MAG TPA: permease prefix domain 1-containing protein [Jatrophihabitans sp.]|nr:permease prefix domain 1-containing protein [Jatrophihabitans sp.]
MIAEEPDYSDPDRDDPDREDPDRDEPDRDDPVEAYLDAVLSSSPGTPRQVRRTLAEVEAHLADAVRDLQAGGLPEPAARAEAVRRMGAPADAVDRPWPAGSLWPPRRLRRRLVLAVLQIGGIAGLALGLAGAISAMIQAVWGSSAIATAFPPGAYSQADCRQWLAAYPHSTSCVAAMISDHAFDFQRAAALAGVLGLVALLLRHRLRRRWPDAAGTAVELLVGAGLAAVTAIIFAGNGFNAITVTHGQGAGQPISLALAASCAAVLLAAAARRSAGRPFWGRRAGLPR